MTKIIHNGVVIDQATQLGVDAGYRVEAWDASGVIPDMLGYGVTDDDGRFTLVQTAENVNALFGARRAVAYLRVLKLSAAGPATVVADTRDDTTWDLRASTSSSRIFADLAGLGSVEELAKLVVRGVLNDVEGGPVDPAGMTARAYDIRLQSEVALASVAVSLDGRGRYRIEYDPSELGSKVRPDLQVRINAAAVIAQSEIQCGAPPALVLDLITDGTATLLPAGTAYRGPIGEAETTTSVTPHLDGASIPALSDAQVESLACTAGVDASRVYALRDADILATATSGSSLTRGVFYGLIRQGIGSTEDAMFSVPAAQLRRALAAAVEARDTAYLDETELDEVEAELVEHQVTRAFVDTASNEANFGDMVQIALDETGTETDAAKAFVRRYARRDGESIETFWFLPRDLTSLVLWLRADRNVTQTTGNVTAWGDQSADGNDASEAVDTPSYVADAGSGLPGIVFDAVGPGGDPENVTIPFTETSTSLTVVVRMIQGGSGYRVALSSVGSPKLLFFVDDGNGFVGVDDGTVRQAGATATNGEHTYAWVVDGEAASLATYLDGAELGTASIAATGQLNTDTALGKEDGGTTGPVQSTLYEVLVFNRALDADELQRVHDYILANPWLDETYAVRNRLQLTLQWGALARYHKPMLARLEALREGATATSLRDLATFTKSDWDAQVALTGAPADIPGADEAERKDNYAKLLTRTMEQAMFTAHLQGRVAAIASPTGTDTNVVTVLSNPANDWFELGRTRVATFAETGDFTGVTPGAETEAVVKRLKQYERLYKLTDEYDVMESFLTAGLDSAHAVSNKGVTQLMAATGLSQQAAEQVQKAAKCQAHKAMHLWGMFNANLSGPTMVAVANYTKPSATLSPAQQADWESMFGSLNMCRCEHCRSVYSAAAYMVDMLQF
ncbi:MAG: hypothetical protein KC731_30970, partial [Myxococcales bacterium]|nr:hypothetical protein [Myxococcales bacterium]